VFRRWFVSLLHPSQTLPELAAIAFLWLLYLSLIVPAAVVGPFNQLDISPVIQAWSDPNFRQPGVEHERLAGVLVPVQIGLEHYDHLPTWNPYLGSGEPIINNTFSYLFNPLYSLPLLLLGGVEGSKLATALSLLIAGYSMWALARAIGVGGVGRVTAGALYMMSGGIAAKYYTGHFQLGLSLAWVPLVFAGLWWTLRSQDRRAPLLMAAAFALLFTSGNIYYTLHTLVCCLVIFAAHIVSRDSGHWRIQWQRARRAAIGGAFAVGLSALQFMPVLATSNFIIHSGDPELITRYSLEQAVINLTYPWEQWQPAFDAVPPLNMLVVVDYNSIGVAAVLFVGRAAAPGFVGLRFRGEPAFPRTHARSLMEGPRAHAHSFMRARQPLLWFWREDRAHEQAGPGHDHVELRHALPPELRPPLHVHPLHPRAPPWPRAWALFRQPCPQPLPGRFRAPLAVPIPGRGRGA
jgi:chromate transport protein ChrA